MKTRQRDQVRESIQNRVGKECKQIDEEHLRDEKKRMGKDLSWNNPL